MEAFVAAPNVEIEACSSSRSLPALIVRRRRYLNDEDEAENVETLCDASEAARLTRAFGMVERFQPARIGVEFESIGVLAPCLESAVPRAWEIVPRREAEYRAKGELQEFGWTTMPTARTSYLRSEKRPSPIQITLLKRGPVADAITAFEFKPSPGVHVTGERFVKHNGFHIMIRRDGQIVDWKTYETVISVQKALRLAQEAAETGPRLPETILVDAEALEADRAAWQAAVASAHAKGRRYTFVPLGDRPPEPLPDTAAYG